MTASDVIRILHPGITHQVGIGEGMDWRAGGIEINVKRATLMIFVRIVISVLHPSTIMVVLCLVHIAMQIAIVGH